MRPADPPLPTAEPARPEPVDDVHKALTRCGESLPNRLRYDLTSLFPLLKGFRGRSEIEAAVRTLRRLAPVLRPMLAGGESIRSVLPTQRVGGGEPKFFFVPVVAVVTDARVILVVTNQLGRPRPVLWSIGPAGLVVPRRTLSSWLRGFAHVRASDLAQISFLVPTRGEPGRVVFRVLKDLERHAGSAAGQIPTSCLCGHCFAPVETDDDACPACGEMFWSPASVLLFSFSIPGWSGLFLRDPVLFLWDAIMTPAVLAALLYGVPALVLMLVNGGLNDPVGPIFLAIALSVPAYVFWTIITTTYRLARTGRVPKRWPKWR
ncbi:MAG: hypothetical protein AAF532_11345 [Planctomycetota bacterium]